MEIKKTTDGSVYKFIHADSSETAIKDVGGCSGLGPDASAKYSVFASCSYGCVKQCKFCMLHTKGTSYRRIPPINVMSNIYHATSYAVTERPSLKKKKIKLSWMGMGEPFLEIGPMLFSSKKFIEYALRQKLASGFDCIDIGTSLPFIKGYKNLYQDIIGLLHLDLRSSWALHDLEGSDLSTRERPLIRVFASIGSFDDDRRTELMGSGNFDTRLTRLNYALKTQNIHNAVICHLVLLDGVNDDDAEVERVVTYFKNHPEIELRLLRYNHCSGSPYVESERFEEISNVFLGELKKVKVQMSPGSEVMAACGQFLV